MKISTNSKLLFILTFLSLSGILITSSMACSKDYYKPYAEWRESNGQPYLYARSPDYYTLGVLKAQYLSQQYITFDYALKGMIQNFGIPLDYAYYLASLYDEFIPSDYQNEMQGIADTLPLTYYDVLLQKSLFDGFYGQIIPDMTGLNISPIHLGGCTVVASKNADGSITIGQNMDLSYFFKDTINFVLYKIRGKRPVFTMNMGASHLVGKTKKVTAVLNLVETVIHGEISMPTSIKRRMALENSRTAFGYQRRMRTNGFASSWNWLIGDKYENLISCESIPSVYNDHILTEGEVVVKSNTFKTEEYKPYLLNPTYSLERQAKAEELSLNAMNDGILTLDELFGDILSYSDNTEASITRIPSDNPNDPILTSTVAFIGIQGNEGKFGIGNPLESNWGVIPL